MGVSPEVKKANFKRIAINRVGTLIDTLRKITNLSHTGNYNYSREDVDKVFSRIRSEVDACEKQFLDKLAKKQAGILTLEDNTEDNTAEE